MDTGRAFCAKALPLKDKRGFIVKNLIKLLVVLSFVSVVSAPALASTHYCEKERTHFISEAQLHTDPSVEAARYSKNPDAFNEEVMAENDRYVEFVIKCGTQKQAISSMQKELRRLYNQVIQMTTLAEHAPSHQTQSTITIQPSRPSMEELIMQQPTHPPVSNNINCTSRDVNGTVYTNCN
jgi:hypothetical protein